MPKNMNQLVTVLPKSKYESDTLDTQNSVSGFDRQNIIHMAQQIFLPPIREIDSTQT